MCSAAALVLPKGAFTTITPLAEAQSTSTLSMPTPARATSFRRMSASSRALSTVVPLRVMMAS